MQPLEVIQFHFIAWPDHGVPDNCAVMLNFIRRVRKLHPYSNPCPLLVHCSAGVGRTGTFIVLDTMLERMKEEDTLNIYDYVTKLRKQRVLMVQTLVRPSKYRIVIVQVFHYRQNFRRSTYSFMMPSKSTYCVGRRKS